MRKSILRLCALALFGVMSNGLASAQDVEATYHFRVLDVAEKTVTLVSVTNKSQATKATIPATVNKDGANADGYKYEIEGLPSGEATSQNYDVVEIASEAFASCAALNEVTVPATVTTIRTLAFHTDKDICIYIPNANVLTRVEKFAFVNKKSKSKSWKSGYNAITSWTPELAKANEVGGNNQVLFYNADLYGTIKYGSSVMDLSGLTKEGSNILQPGAFAYTLLAKKIIWGTMKSVPDSLFLGATAWKDDNTTPSTFSEIEGLIFEVPLTNNLTKVGNASFAFSDLRQFGYKDGSNYVLPATLNEVADYGFACCKKLDGPTGFRHNSTVNNRIEKVGKYAFAGDAKIVLGDAYYDNVLQEQGFENIFATFDKLTYEEGSFANCGLTGINLASSTINPIPDYAFAGQTGAVGNLVLPNGCTSIGDYAFANDNIATLNFPATLATIGEEAFACKTASTSTVFNLVGEYKNGGYASTHANHWSAGLIRIGKNAFKNRTTENIYTHGYIGYNEKSVYYYYYPVMGTQESFTVSNIYAPAQADKEGKGLIPAMKEEAENNYWYENTALKYPTTTGAVTYAGVNYELGVQATNTGLYAVTVSDIPNGENGATIYAQFIGEAGENGYVPAFYFNGFKSLTTKTFDKNITFATGEVAPNQTYNVDPLATIPMLWSAGQLNKDYVVADLLPASTFSGFTALTGVTFKSGFTKIGTSAFEGCTALATVDATNVTAIGEKAFASDAALATFSDFSKVTTIGENAFWSCAALKQDITFSKDLTNIGNYAFRYSGVTNVTANDEAASISLGYQVFDGCKNLEKAIVPGFATMDVSVFSDCPKLATATIGATTIKERTFQNSGNEGAGLTVTANNATKIEANAFTGSKVVSFTGDNLATLDATAFQNCADLKNFSAKVLETIPAKAFVRAGNELVMNIPAVKTIETQAFHTSGVISLGEKNVIEDIASDAFGSSTIKSVNLPSIKNLGGCAFMGCNALESFVAGESLSLIGLNTFKGAGADKFDVTLNGVKTIMNSAFEDSKLTKITLPKLTTITDATSFKDCKMLANFEAAELTEIPTSAFAGAGAEDGLTVKAPKLETINAQAFSGSTLTSIEANNVATIGEDAFSNATKLVNVNFPVVKLVESDAFKDCTALESAILNNGGENSPAFSVLGEVFEGAGTKAEGKSFTVTTAAATIDADAFKGSYVVTVNANKVTSLDAGAFDGCLTIKTFSAPELETILANTFQGTDENPNTIEIVNLPKVKTIGENAFKYSNLASVTFPATLSSIGSAAFAYTNLTGADFSDATGLTTIPTYAFTNCSKLAEVDLGNVTTVGAGAFAGTTLKEVTLPTTLQNFGDGAFGTGSIETVKVSYDVADIPALTVDAFVKNDAGNYDAVLHVTGTATREDYLNKKVNKIYSIWKKFFIDNNITISVNGIPIASDEKGVFTLVDNVEKVEIKSPYSGNFKYVRNFTSTAWQCWFVPFDIEAGAVEGIKFAMLYDTDNTGGATRIEYKEITDPSTIIKANVPYLVKPEVEKEYTFNAGKLEKTVTNTTATVSNLENVYTFSGTYTKKDGKNYEANPWYGLNAKKGNFALAEGTGAYINAYRFYMTIEGNGSNPTEYVKFVVLDDEDATGISDINSNEIAEGAMFDLQGRKINAPVKGQVYIQNGVKKLAK